MRILFVGTAWSPHLARWIGQLDGRGWDVHLFPLVVDEGLHPDLRDITVHDAIHGRPRGAHESVRAVDDFWPFVKDGYPFPRGAMTARRIEHNFFPKRADRAWRLAYAIRKLQPDVIHSMTIWPAGDLIMEAKQHLGESFAFPPWIVSAWGSDIYLFPRLAEYREKIRAVLSTCDYFTCDCRRDTKTATALGFHGELLPVLPVAGGFDVDGFDQFRSGEKTSARRLILLKGYQNVPGRGLVGVRALTLCADELKDYRVAVYLADAEVKVAAEIAQQTSGLQIEIVPKCSHEDILRLHGRARVSIGLSISDGLPLSLLEAMAMGSFPVQSGTSCADEWTRDGETCLIVPPEDPEAVAVAVRRAVSDDALVDAAAETNTRVIAERLDNSVIRPQIIAMYEKAFVQGRRAQAATTRGESHPAV